MKLQTILKIAKSLSVKREKTDEGSWVIARLKFTDCFLTREQVDELMGQSAGWARKALYDELGAPIAALCIELLGREMSAAVRISDDTSEMHVTTGVLSDMSVELSPTGALLAGMLSWPVAGDEVSDVEPLLGKDARIDASLTDGWQGDLLKAA